MRIKFLQIKRVMSAALFVLLMVVGMTKMMAQQQNQTKLTDYNFRNLGTIEERVFLLHYIQENEFFSYGLSDEEGKIDIYVLNEYTCQDSNANSDFDFFLENLYDEWVAYSNLDKTERGSLFVEWRYQLEDNVFLAINEDFNRQLRDVNASCDGAIEFSSLEGVYQFPASVNAGNLGSSTPPYFCSGFVRPTGFSTTCLSTTPNPAFYYMQIAEPGNLNIYMYSEPSHDIDFDCWGPFSDIETACSQLSCSNLVDCSYSANATENCYINNAQSGQYYILLITNYSNQSGMVYFQNIGTGGTGCSGQKTVTANVNSNYGGTVTGGGVYDCGSSCTLTATANEGYVFMDWTNEDGVVVSTDAIYTFDVWGNRNIIANFVEDNSCYLTFNLNDSNGNGWSGNYLVLNFEDGSSQKLTVPYDMSASSYSLPIVDGSHVSLGWISGLYTDQCSFTVSYSNGNMICYGNNLNDNYGFEFDVDCVGMPVTTFVITATASPSECGTVVGAGEYDCGSSCTLMAVANEGYVFVDWVDDNGMTISTEVEYTFTVYNNKNITANFRNSRNCEIRVAIHPQEGGTVSANKNSNTRDGEWLHYDDGVRTTNVGGSGTLYWGSMFPAASLTPYVGRYMTKVALYENNENTGVVTVKIYFGGTTAPETLVSTMNFNPVGGDAFHEVALSTPVAIDGTQNLWITFYQNGDSYPAAACNDTGDPNNRWVSIDGANWQDLAYAGVPGYGWMIRAFVEIEFDLIENYLENETCTLMATANENYVFKNWTENDVVVSTDATYSFTVESDRTLVANFEGSHWSPVNYPNSMFMIGVVTIDGVEQTSPRLELGAFCNGECRGTTFPVYEEGHWLYYITIGGDSGDGLTFRLYDHDSQQELNLHCFNEIPFVHYGLIGLDDPYEVLFASLFTVSAVVNPEDAGTVSGTGTYINGTEATLTASPNEYSIFINWTIGDEQVSTETVYSFIVTGDVTLVANFLPRYEISVSVNPIEGGTVTGAGLYDNGTECTLMATASAGYGFRNWTVDGEIVSEEPSYTFVVTNSVNITANFGVLCTVSAVVSPENSGTITGMGEYPLGAEATLTAIANEGYAFNSWTIDGEIVSMEPAYTFIVTGALDLTANFDVLYSVSAVVNPEDAGTVTGAGDYVSGTEATLTATANEGYVFNNWTLDGEIVSTEPTYTFAVTGSVNLTANFNSVRTHQLVEGWNWWSTDLDITLDDLKAALVAALPSSTITIQSQTQNASYNPNNNRWTGRLTYLDVTQMYKINVSIDCEITLAGTPINLIEHSVIIQNGNNWIGYPLHKTMSVNDALVGFPAVNGDIIQSQTNNSVFTRGAWRGALMNLEPGQGYIFQSTVQEDRTLTFPADAK